MQACIHRGGVAFIAGLLMAAMPAQAADQRVDSPAVSQLFREAGVSGTFVLYDVAAKRYTIHGRKRAETRYIPASTFKIPNTLIGLTMETVLSVDDVLPYGGKPQRRKEWERDMSLRDAIKVSNVPVFQELARRTDLPKMKAQIERINYGNNYIGTVVDTFWLVGPLKISAFEQTRFLARLADDTLPLPKDAMAQTREILLQEKTSSYALYAKTGWTDAHKPDLGWWVGWVSKGGKTYAFALNIDMPGEDDHQKRVPLGRASLAALGVLPAAAR